ncbi:MAG TPA: hypothetical protein VK171_01635, partial [Fimbriimonas sp.]|nr:hypothetical protein [Fimbriimonas sp.]
GFCAPALIKSQGKGSSRTINMRAGTEAHPSFQIVYSKFKLVGKHWVPSRIDMKYFEQVEPRKLGKVVSTTQFDLVSGSESEKTQFHRIDEFFAPQTSVTFSQKHGESKTLTYTRGKTSLKARLQAALAMQ